jgi:ABC-type transport system substrate-binding protein
MNLLLVPFQYIEKTIYKIRDAFWEYPDLLEKENLQKTRFYKIYTSSLPYSNFTSSFLLVLTATLILSTLGLPRIFGSDLEGTLIEGVITGEDFNGNVQKLTKVNPLLASNIQFEKDLVELIYEPLIKIDFVEKENGRFIGGVEEVLAQEVITRRPGSFYQFILRQDVEWHDGETFDADDVIRTFEILNEIEDTDSNSNAYTRALKDMHWEKLDRYTISICTKPKDDFKGPCSETDSSPIFSNFLELLSFKIIPSHLTSDLNGVNAGTSIPNLYRSPIGTGRYIFDDITDRSVSLAVNRKHRNFGLIKTLEFELPDNWDNQSVKNIIEENKESLEMFNKDNFKILDNKEYSDFVEDRKGGNILFVNQENDFSHPGDSKHLIFQEFDFGFKDRISNIKFIYYDTLESAVSAIEAGEVHTLSSISTEYKNKVDQYSHIGIYESPVIFNQFWGLYFNLRTKPDGTSLGPSFMQDPEVRKAISAAISRKNIIDESLSGVGYEALGPIPSLSYFFNDKTEWINFNKVNSAKILTDRGWEFRGGDEYRSKFVKDADGKDVKEFLEFTLYYVNSEDRHNIAEQIRADLAEIGVKVNITKPGEEDNLEWKGWDLKELNEQILAPRLFDVVLYGMNTFIDPDRYELYHSSQALHPGLNISGYKGTETTIRVNPDRSSDKDTIEVSKVDQFLEEARSFDPVKDIEARRDRYYEIQDLIAAEAPVIYLYHPKYLYFANNMVKSVNLDNANAVEDRFRNVFQWKLDE